MSKLNFILNESNIFLLINGCEPFFGFLLGGIKIKVGEYKEFKYAACTYNSIFIQSKYVEEVQNDKAKLNQFITVILHEIYHIYLNHNWRFGLHEGALYSEYKDKPYLKHVINLVLDAIINTNLKVAGYSFDNIDGIFLHSLLDENHPRLKDNNWGEEELLLEVLSNSKITEQPLLDQDCKNIGSFYNITLPSGETVSTLNIDLDVLTSNVSENEIDDIKELASKAARDIKSKGLYPGKLSSNILPPDLPEVKNTDIDWQDRLKQVALTSSCTRFITDYDAIKSESFYSFELGIVPFNKCSVEYNYKPLQEPNTVLVFIDLSGSIYSSPRTLKTFLNQITDIANCIGNLILVTFDVDITGVYSFDMSEYSNSLGDTLIEQKEEYLKGGGGTDVVPVFKALLENFKDYNIDFNIDNVCMLVVLTDLYLNPVELELEPINSLGSIPTIWAVCDLDYNTNHDLEFGELLLIK